MTNDESWSKSGIMEQTGKDGAVQQQTVVFGRQHEAGTIEMNDAGSRSQGALTSKRGKCPRRAGVPAPRPFSNLDLIWEKKVRRQSASTAGTSSRQDSISSYLEGATDCRAQGTTFHMMYQLLSRST